MGYSPWGRKESNTSEQLYLLTCPPVNTAAMNWDTCELLNYGFLMVYVQSWDCWDMWWLYF